MFYFARRALGAVLALFGPVTSAASRAEPDATRRRRSPRATPRQGCSTTPTATRPFHEFATVWFDRHSVDLDASTMASFSRVLSRYILPEFKDHRLTEITLRSRRAVARPPARRDPAPLQSFDVDVVVSDARGDHEPQTGKPLHLLRSNRPLGGDEHRRVRVAILRLAGAHDDVWIESESRVTNGSINRAPACAHSRPQGIGAKAKRAAGTASPRSSSQIARQFAGA
ncbi:MAG: hypothetical protein ACRDQH_11130 [Pseudonocardiaceae bacterium]